MNPRRTRASQDLLQLANENARGYPGRCRSFVSFHHVLPSSCGADTAVFGARRARPSLESAKRQFRLVCCQPRVPHSRLRSAVRHGTVLVRRRTPCRSTATTAEHQVDKSPSAGQRGWDRLADPALESKVVGCLDRTSTHSLSRSQPRVVIRYWLPPLVSSYARRSRTRSLGPTGT